MGFYRNTTFSFQYTKKKYFKFHPILCLTNSSYFLFTKELELIEEQWRAESNDLLSLVSNLQEENRRLQKLLSPIGESKPTNTTLLARDDSSANPAQSDFQVLQRLRAQIEKHRKELKIKEAELAEADQTAQGVNNKLNLK